MTFWCFTSIRLSKPITVSGAIYGPETKAHLIIMDVQMPVMDGIEAIRLLKTSLETKDINILAITSFG